MIATLKSKYCNTIQRRELTNCIGNAFLSSVSTTHPPPSWLVYITEKLFKHLTQKCFVCSSNLNLFCRVMHLWIYISTTSPVIITLKANMLKCTLYSNVNSFKMINLIYQRRGTFVELQVEVIASKLSFVIAFITLL